MPAETPDWPPPPELASIAELVRAADPEGLLAEGAHSDEYDPEERAILLTLHGLASAQLVAADILPGIQRVWLKSFPDDAPTPERQQKLLHLAQQIERFFGPQSKPITRALLRDPQ